MNALTPPPGYSADDYSAIEEAVMETERGRWFLLEYARRQRATETQGLFDAIARLESVVTGKAVAPMALEPPREALAALPDGGAEQAGDIARKLADIVWDLREAGASERLCNDLEVQVGLLARLADRHAQDANALIEAERADNEMLQIEGPGALSAEAAARLAPDAIGEERPAARETDVPVAAAAAAIAIPETAPDDFDIEDGSIEDWLQPEPDEAGPAVYRQERASDPVSRIESERVAPLDGRSLDVDAAAIAAAPIVPPAAIAATRVTLESRVLALSRLDNLPFAERLEIFA